MFVRAHVLDLVCVCWVCVSLLCIGQPCACRARISILLRLWLRQRRVPTVSPCEFCSHSLSLVAGGGSWWMPSTCQPTRSDPSVRVHALSSGTQRQGRRRAVAWYPVPADPDTRPVSRASCEVMDARRDSCDPGWRSDCVVVRVTSPFLVAYPAEVERQQEQLTADLSDVSDSEDDAPGGGAFAPPSPASRCWSTRSARWRRAVTAVAAVCA